MRGGLWLFWTVYGFNVFLVVYTVLNMSSTNWLLDKGWMILFGWIVLSGLQWILFLTMVGFRGSKLDATR